MMDWLDERFGVRDFIKNHLTHNIVPSHVNTLHYIGGIAVLVILVQLFTGILLMLYYVPTEAEAFLSVERINNHIPFGWLFHNLHVVGASVLIILIMLHMLRVYWHGAFKSPRELHWLSGMLLLLLVLGMAFTGYLLPWSQLSYWASTIGIEMIRAIPFLGNSLARLLRGSNVIDGVTLRRFYTIHTIVLPLLIGAVMVLHYALKRKTGVAPNISKIAKLSVHNKDNDKGKAYFPYHFMRHGALVFLLLAILLTLALMMTPTPQTPADRLNSTEQVKPEWYFLASYQLLKIVPIDWLGILMQVAFIFFLFSVPIIESKEKPLKERRLPMVTAGFITILYLVLTYWGAVS
jgi:ubiquinol-cytochrome c reductase cytochrome b subunit